MKNLSIVLTVLIAFSGHAFAYRDAGTKYSNNIIKVDLDATKTLIRFSYCEDKKNIKTCELLGKGIYLVKDINDFANSQGWKALANGLGAALGLPGGITLLALGGAATGTGAMAPVGVPMCIAGFFMTKYGWKAAGDCIETFVKYITFTDELLADKYVDFTNVTIQGEPEKEEDSMKYREEVRVFNEYRAKANYDLLKYNATVIEAALNRLKVIKTENRKYWE